MTQPTRVYSDSKSTISVVRNPVQYDHMKHVRIDRNFIKREIDEGGIILSYVPTMDQIARVHQSYDETWVRISNSQARNNLHLFLCLRGSVGRDQEDLKFKNRKVIR